VIGDSHFEGLVAAAPVNLQHITPDWSGVAAALESEGVLASSVLAVSWCDFSTVNIEANVDPTVLAIVHQGGVIATTGKRKLLGGKLKYSTIPFAKCRAFGPTEYVDDRGYGKYCIDFGAAGSVLLGRLEWDWKGKRFRDSSAEMIAVAEERDRILEVVSPLI